MKREFLEYIEIERGRSLNTVVNYDRYLSRLIEFTKAKSPSELTESKIREFRLWLNRQSSGQVCDGRVETLKKRTQNYYLIALRSFLKFMMKRGVKSLAPDAIELAKLPERQVDIITSQELERLLAAPNGAEPEDLRDKAMLELLFSTGLRVSELCSLARDIDLSRDELSVRGKGEKVRVVFVSPESKTAIKTYLSKRKDMDDRLFPITPRSVERLVKKYAIKAGISKKVTPHIIRHSFATDLLQNGADLRSVQAMLGHANIATTQIYTHVTDKHLKDVHRAFHSKGRK